MHCRQSSRPGAEVERAHDLALRLRARTRNTRPPETTGEECPVPTLSFQPGASVSGQLARGRESRSASPSRSGSAPLRPVGRASARRRREAARVRTSTRRARARHSRSYSERSDASTGRRSTAAGGQRATRAGRRRPRPPRAGEHRGERAAASRARASAGQDRDERRRRCRPRGPGSSSSAVSREHHASGCAPRAVADRAQQRQLAAPLEGVAHQHRAEADRAEQQARARPASGTSRCTCSRRGGTRRAAPRRSSASKPKSARRDSSAS